MYIFDKNENKIDIYKMEARKKDIKRYKEEVIKNNKKNLLYSFDTNYSNTMKDFETSSAISLNKINCQYAVGPWHSVRSNILEKAGTANLEEINKSIEKYSSLGSYDGDMLYLDNKHKQKLENYLDGLYDNSSMIKVIGYNEAEKYYFLKTEEAEKELLFEEYHMKGIIDLPLKLYILHLLLQGDFAKLKNRNISEQLSLFNIDYYKSFSLDDIHDLINSGLINATYEETMQKVATDSLILKRIKK